MRLSHHLVIATAVAASAAVGIGTAVAAGAAAGVGTAASAGTAAGSAATVAAPYRPISPDAPFDNQLTNVTCGVWPRVRPPAGADYGHLPRWAHGPNGSVILREDRVDLRRPDWSHCYSNVNPLIRSYTLDRNVVVSVLGPNYTRMTGRPDNGYSVLHRVSRQQFLDSYNTKDGYARYLRYHSVYRLTFSGTRIVRVTEVGVNWRYGVCGC